MAGQSPGTARRNWVAFIATEILFPIIRRLSHSRAPTNRLSKRRPPRHRHSHGRSMGRTAPRAAALQVSFSRFSKALGFVDRPSLFAIFGETPVPITEVE